MNEILNIFSGFPIIQSIDSLPYKKVQKILTRKGIINNYKPDTIQA